MMLGWGLLANWAATADAKGRYNRDWDKQAEGRRGARTGARREGGRPHAGGCDSADTGSWHPYPMATPRGQLGGGRGQH
jgi:hypothetical protein